MAEEASGLSKSKSICVMLVVIGCFGVLWPKIFYPMIQCGLSWRNEGLYSFEHSASEQMLPPKVREAMRSNPTREPIQVQRLPGRPQFYSGPRDGRSPFGKVPPSQGGGFMNFMMPVYTLIIVVFFLYIMLRMSFSNDHSDQRGSLSMRNVPIPKRTPPVQSCGEFSEADASLRSRLRAAQMSKPRYRALNHSARDNVMRSLIKDVQIFRDHLQEAQVCKCKIKKYEMARKEAESCLQEKNQPEQSLETDPEAENLQQELFNEMSLSESVHSECDSEMAKTTTDDAFEEEEADKENASPQDNEDQNHIETNTTKMKHRKRRKLHSPNTEIENVPKELGKIIPERVDSNVLGCQLNQEINRLMHTKNE